jgi:hypothetical protein
MKTTLDMAREADFSVGDKFAVGSLDDLKHFEDLIRANEREACAKVCDDLHPGLATKRAAELIRARGKI